MADQTVYFGASVSGDAATPANAVGSTAGTWAGGPLNSGTSWTHTWSFTNPTEPQLRAESQSVTVRMRKGSNSGTPSVTVTVARAGVTLATVGPVNVTSTTGQDVVASWTPTVGDPSDGVQVTVACTAAGGSPSARNSAQIDYGSWLAKTQAASTPNAGSGAGTLAWAGAASGARPSAGAGAGALSWDGAAAGEAPTGGGGSPAVFVASSRSGAADSLGTINTCPVPAGAAAGMTALLAIEIFLDGSIATATWPEGFTEIVNEPAVPSNGVQLLIAKKTLTGADTGSYVTTLNASRWNMSMCVLVSGGVTVSTPDTNSVKNGSGTSITSLSLTSTAAPVLIHFQANSSAATHTPPTGYTERQEGDYITVATSEPGTTGTHSTSGATQSTSTVWAAALIGVEGGSAGPTPNQGAGAGALAWTGTASGSRTSGGTSAGTLTLTGAAAGARASQGAGASSLSLTGAAAGSRASTGSGTGSLSWTGTATGTAPSVGANDGAGAGTLTWSGTAAGSRPSSGATTSTLDWTGTATGDAPSIGANEGAGSGTLTWTGTASGTRASQGTGAGAIAWTGTATGNAPAPGQNAGQGAGALLWTGTAAGSRSSKGSGAQAVTWAGFAAGTRTSAGASATVLEWTGAAAGFATDIGAPVPHPGLTLGTPGATMATATATASVTLGAAPDGLTLTTHTSRLELT